MATLRNKKKLAAVSRETPESTRSGRTQSILDPELTQDYISQVSEEIEGRVTKKLSKEFSRTESRILGALSKLDEFLLNSQVWTCSVAVPGTSRSSNLENQGTNEDRPSDDPGPEVEFSSPHFVAETNPHNDRSFSTRTCVVLPLQNELLSQNLSLKKFLQNLKTSNEDLLDVRGATWHFLTFITSFRPSICCTNCVTVCFTCVQSLSNGFN